MSGAALVPTQSPSLGSGPEDARARTVRPRIAGIHDRWSMCRLACTGRCDRRVVGAVAPLKPCSHQVVVHVVDGCVRSFELRSIVSDISGREFAEFGTVRPRVPGPRPVSEFNSQLSRLRRRLDVVSWPNEAESQFVPASPSQSVTFAFAITTSLTSGHSER
jgi:hypothetical protein